MRVPMYNPGHELLANCCPNINVDECIRGQITWENIDTYGEGATSFPGRGHHWRKNVLELDFKVRNWFLPLFLH